MGRVDAAVDALMAARPPWAENVILAGLRGSDAHGSKLPEGHPRHTDDTDVFGVAVHPVDWYLGLGGYSSPKRKLSWDTAGDYYDHLIHDVRKFFALLLKGNPNVHCWLWADPKDRVVLHPAGQAILDNREAFLSRHCFNALAGYARAQMAKMDRKRFQGYQGAKRKEMVRELGYDVKHAAHCIRLLNMGIELATTGRMSTRRPPHECEILREIKGGDWSFRKTDRYAKNLWKRFRDAEARSDLPEDPDSALADTLLLDVIRRAQARQTPEGEE